MGSKFFILYQWWLNDMGFGKAQVSLLVGWAGPEMGQTQRGNWKHCSECAIVIKLLYMPNVFDLRNISLAD